VSLCDSRETPTTAVGKKPEAVSDLPSSVATSAISRSLRPSPPCSGATSSPGQAQFVEDVAVAGGQRLPGGDLQILEHIVTHSSGLAWYEE